MRLLLHTCCAPCSIYPVETLRGKGIDVMGFFYPHNIHPYTECHRRKESMIQYSGQIGLKTIYKEGYDIEGFLQKIVFREKERCSVCYHERLQATAVIARKGRFDSFSTTLLYSRFQDHEKIKAIGESVGKAEGVFFHYSDFRSGWKNGIEESKRLGLYRQQYCGCIYSEKERYFNTSSGQHADSHDENQKD